MTIQINYKTSNLIKASSNLILFVDEKFNIGGLKKHISTNEFSYISDLLKNSDLKKDFLFFDVMWNMLKNNTKGNNLLSILGKLSNE